MGVFHEQMKPNKVTVMDLTISKKKHTKRSHRTLTMNGEMVELQKEDAMELDEEHLKVAKPLQDEDKHFTAEHILQLCRFLAEKAKRSRELILQQQLNKCQLLTDLSEVQDKKCHSNTSQTSLILHTNDISELKTVPTTTTTANHKTNMDISHILSDRLTTTTANFANVPAKSSLNTNATLVANHQSKREVLLKIRHQIFERRKQRQMLAHGMPRMDVWRPW